MEDLVVDGRDIAAALKTHPGSIRAHRAGIRTPAILEGLPEPIQTKPKLLWLKADIEAWVESRRTFRPDTPAVAAAAHEPAPVPTTPTLGRGRGRPRKTTTPVKKERGAA